MTKLRFAVGELIVLLEWYGGVVVQDKGGERVTVTSTRGVEDVLRDRIRKMTELEMRLWHHV